MTFRITVHAFVKDAGQVTKVKNIGTSTLAHIIASRPDRGRYVVGEVSHISSTPWWSIDLPSIVILPTPTPPNYRFELGDYWEYRDYDAALMATVLRAGE